MRSSASRHKNGLRASRAIAAWLPLIHRSRLHEVEPFACVSDLLTRLAEYRDMPDSRKAAEGEAFLRSLLLAAWLSRNPACRLSLSR